MKCVAYLRVSGTTQADLAKDGLPRQLAACRSYASTHGLDIVRTYADEGVSGTKEIENRPALFQLRADLLANGVRTVVVENMSRLARDLMVSETILADFQKNGITLLSTQEPDLCSNEPSRKFMRQILSAVAEFDRATLVARMKAGKVRARANGKECGRASYGKHREHPEESEIVNRVLQLHEKGHKVSQITNLLTSEGFRTRKGTQFAPMQVSRILLSSARSESAI